MIAARKLHVRQWEHQSPSEHYKVEVTRGGEPVPGVQSDRISGIEEELMYWRKANHIHGWFVDNVQGGQDDCREYLVKPEHLRELISVCSKVINASKLVDGMIYTGTVYTRENPKGIAKREAGKVIADATVAKQLLPNREGFFFGPTDEYDEWYLDQVMRTRQWAKETLRDIESGVPGYIYYSSSW